MSRIEDGRISRALQLSGELCGVRIIAGTTGGRRLLSPGGSGRGGHAIRPTSDRAREAVFSIIGNKVRDARVLDLFAGTGALGLEALSRGARSAVFVDHQRSAIDLIRKNIARCGFADRTLVVKRDLGRDFSLHEFLPAGGFGLVFADPPYDRNLSGQVLARLGGAGNLLANPCLVVVEAAHDQDLPAQAGGLFLFDRRRYGEAAFWLYRNNEEPRHDLL